MNQFVRQAARMAVENGAERLAGDVFHDDPGLAMEIFANIEEGDEVWVFEIEALPNAAQLNVGLVAAQEFQGDFFAAIAEGEINFAKASLADAAFDGVAVQWLLSGAVGESHDYVRRA